RIHQGIAAALVGADVEQILRGCSGGQNAAKRGGETGAFGGVDPAGDPAYRPERIHRRKVPCDGELAVENDVTVEDASGRVRDGFVVVVAVDEDRVEPRNRAAFGGASTLQELC